MKKSRVLHLGMLVLVLALLSFSLVSGTLAKYVTTLDATGTVTVAKWAIELNGQTTTKTTTFDVVHADANAASTKVAPGTTGTFALKYTTTGTEVAHQVKIALKSTDALAADLSQLKFYKDATMTSQITLGDAAFFTADHDTGAAEQTVNVYWKWDFAGNDAVDTEDGIAAETYNMTATLTVTQKD